LIGSALTESERQWVTENISRPFHHISLPVDDVTVWEFLFAVSQQNFGWLHIDCLVLNSDLFGEMRSIAPTDSVNGTWWLDSVLGSQVATTYFIFVNVAAVRALRAARISATPNCYSHYPFNRGAPGRRYYSDRPTRRQRGRLLRMLPPDSPARSAFLANRLTLRSDSLIMHQLMTRSIGFGLHPVRRLGGRRCGHAVEDMSDDLLHVSGISYVDMPGLPPFAQLHYLLADHLALAGSATWLPRPYAERYERVIAELARHGLTAAAAIGQARRYLIDRGLSEQAADAVLRPPRLPGRGSSPGVLAEGGQLDVP
jgi:hypothetical protein